MLIETIAWLDQRAAAYGGTAADILDKTPTHLWDNPEELRVFWDQHDLSHVFPQSLYPHLSDDWSNIVPEDSSVNRARGAQVMTHDEIAEAEINSDSAAMEIDVFIDGDDPDFAQDLLELVF